jgi:hypothetical protein
MSNKILAVVTGVVAWFVLVTVVSPVLRAAWPDYAAVADAMTFTLPMMFARLAIGAVATLAAGCVAARVARRSTFASMATGIVLLVLFIPQHIMLWARFPVWYHLTFLLSLVPLAGLGGTIGGRWRNVGAAGTGPMMHAADHVGR